MRDRIAIGNRAAKRWRPGRAMIGVLAVLVAVGVTAGILVTNLAEDDDDALVAAVRAYVDAIARGDASRANAMVDPVAAVAAVSSIGSALAAHAEARAVLAGLSDASALGAICVIAGVGTTSAPEDRAPIVGLLPPAVGGEFVALLLTAVITDARADTHGRAR
ncbi:hypothetical protein [Actinophytocola sp.]|uniref:hypothetical protein n=1 Tax=Actinophytocola sp. TaxID=1872138 RepID=UPI003D6B0125